MDRLTQHSKTTMFTDSDVMVEGKRLGPAAFEGLSYYRHYVKIINRLAELEDRFCNEPQTHSDLIRAMSDKKLAHYLNNVETDGRVYGPRGEAYWLDLLRQEAHDEP